MFAADSADVPNALPQPMLPFFIRTVRQPDLFSLADVLASSFHSQGGLTGWFYPLLRMGIYEDLRNRSTSRKPYYACLVAVVRNPGTLAQPIGVDRPIGTVELSLRTAPLFFARQPRYLYLSNLAVHAEFRRQGVAQRLLQTCEQLALEWGYSDLCLHVLETNHQAQQLYAKAGYRVRSIESNLGVWLFKRPRQLLLHKRLGGEEKGNGVKGEGNG